MYDPKVKGIGKLERLVLPQLKDGESLLYLANANPAKAVTPLGLPGLGTELGMSMGKAGAVKGEADSIAASVPQRLPVGYLRLLCVTTKRLIFLIVDPARKHSKPLWSTSRAQVAGVEKKPRLHVMAKFTVHFIDGSAVSFMTFRKKTILNLAEILGWWSQRS